VGEESTYKARPRLCDLGYLRTSKLDEAGKATYTCAAEPESAFLKKRGDEKELAARMCLCNGLLAAVGLGQERPDGYKEAPLLTLGATTTDVEDMLKTHPNGWSAKEVVERLLSGVPQSARV
jgi:hypothetical protein